MASATAGKRAQGKSNGGPPSPKHNVDAVREAYYERISKFDMAPLWKVMKSVVTKEPVTRCVPVIWHYDDVKSLVMESGGLISAEEAQRRVLILENPAMRGESRATNTLFAGIQMILPGEVAPVHRHVSSAIRFVLDGEGAYTAVEGEKAFMSPGDFVITANWAPHDHGNPSKKPMLWLDVLDFPAVNFYEASFADYFDEAMQNTTRQDGNSLDLLRLRRAARRRSGRAQPQPGHQLHLCAHAADPRAPEEIRRGRSAPRRARALRQPDQRRPGAAHHGAHRSRCCRRASRARTTARPTAPSSSASKGRAPPGSATRCSNGARTIFSWCRPGSITPTTPPRNRCCSRSPTVRPSRRSASGARTRARARLARASAHVDIVGAPIVAPISFASKTRARLGDHHQRVRARLRRAMGRPYRRT